jgi:hypothetical protein
MTNYTFPSVSTSPKLERRCPNHNRPNGNIHSGIIRRFISDFKVSHNAYLVVSQNCPWHSLDNKPQTLNPDPHFLSATRCRLHTDVVIPVKLVLDHDRGTGIQKPRTGFPGSGSAFAKVSEPMRLL